MDSKPFQREDEKKESKTSSAQGYTPPKEQESKQGGYNPPQNGVSNSSTQTEQEKQAAAIGGQSQYANPNPNQEATPSVEELQKMLG